MSASGGGPQSLLDAAVRDGVTPGACLAWARVGEEPTVLCAGRTEHGGDGATVTCETVYDLASLTKPLCTTAAAMLLVREGTLDLDAPVHRYLPAWRGGRRDDVQVRHLLAHESGLPWWLPLYQELADSDPGAAREQAARRRILELHPERAPGGSAVYSDPGFMLLHEVLQVAAGEPPAALAKRALWDPWGLSLCFVDLQPLGATPRSLAATLRSELRARAEVAPTEDCPWRHRVLRAEVHDDNAHFLGGIAPHAGLFGRALDVLTFGLGLLGGWLSSSAGAELGPVPPLPFRERGQGGEGLRGARHRENSIALGRGRHPLDAAVLQRFFTGGGRVQGSTWALGWDTPSPGGSSAGRLVSDRAVGHLGFTGTSLWLDPTRRAAVALLTNRVHPSRADERIKALRPRVHDAVWASLDQAWQERPGR